MEDIIMSIYYSCKVCKERFNRMDEVENHLEEKHEIFNQEEINKSYLIHFPSGGSQI